MTRTLFLAFAFLSPLFFPWACVAGLAVIAAFLSPVVPFAIGLFADSLYYVHGAAMFPWCALAGALVGAVIMLVRRFFETSIMR